jgi:hypothetical protein
MGFKLDKNKNNSDAAEKTFIKSRKKVDLENMIVARVYELSVYNQNS